MRTFLEPDVGTLLGERLFDARGEFVRFLEVRTRNDLIGLEVAEDGDRHAPGALTRHDPVRPVLDHAGDAVLARCAAPIRCA